MNHIKDIKKGSSKYIVTHTTLKIVHCKGEYFGLEKDAAHAKIVQLKSWLSFVESLFSILVLKPLVI